MEPIVRFFITIVSELFTKRFAVDVMFQEFFLKTETCIRGTTIACFYVYKLIESELKGGIY